MSKAQLGAMPTCVGSQNAHGMQQIYDENDGGNNDDEVKGTTITTTTAATTVTMTMTIMAKTAAATFGDETDCHADNSNGDGDDGGASQLEPRMKRA